MQSLSEGGLLYELAPRHIVGLCAGVSEPTFGLAAALMSVQHAFIPGGGHLGELRKIAHRSQSVDEVTMSLKGIAAHSSAFSNIIDKVVYLERAERGTDPDLGRLVYCLYEKGRDLAGPGKEKTAHYDRLDMGKIGPPAHDCSILSMLSASIRSRIAAPLRGPALKDGDGCKYTLVFPPKNLAFERAGITLSNRKHLPQLLFDFPALDLYYALTDGKGKHATPTSTSMARFRDAGRYELVAAMALTSTDDLVITHRDPSKPTCGLVVRTKNTTERKTVMGALKANLGHFILYAQYALIPPDSHPAAPLTSSSARAPAPLAGAPSLPSALGAAGRGGSF